MYWYSIILMDTMYSNDHVLQGTVFDYYLCHESKKWMPWTDKVPNFELDPEIPLQV